MKLTEKGKCAAAAVVVAVLAGLAHEARADAGAERMSRAYQSAMADYSAGRLDAAIDGFGNAIEANGNNASARFQLACLLQDHRKDWLGAMCSYREYLRLEGRSDKASLARRRMAQCERELAEELAAKYSLSAAPTQPGEDVALSRAHLKEAQKKATALAAELGKAQKELESLRRENARLRRTMRVMAGDAESAAAAAPSPIAGAKEVLAGLDDGDAPLPSPGGAPDGNDDAAPRHIDSSAAALPDDNGSAIAVSADAAAAEPGEDAPPSIREGLEAAKTLAIDEDADAPRMLPPSTGAQDAAQAPGAGGAQGGSLLADLASRMRGDANARAPKDKTSAPGSYTVQQGETLSEIARRFYGQESAWKKIQDANKTIISVDGRVNAGQTIVLP